MAREPNCESVTGSLAIFYVGLDSASLRTIKTTGPPPCVPSPSISCGVSLGRMPNNSMSGPGWGVGEDLQHPLLRKVVLKSSCFPSAV